VSYKKGNKDIFAFSQTCIKLYFNGKPKKRLRSFCSKL